MNQLQTVLTSASNDFTSNDSIVDLTERVGETNNLISTVQSGIQNEFLLYAPDQNNADLIFTEDNKNLDQTDFDEEIEM